MKKKLLLSSGLIIATTAPITAVISCGYGDENSIDKMLNTGRDGWVSFLHNSNNKFDVNPEK